MADILPFRPRPALHQEGDVQTSPTRATEPYAFDRAAFRASVAASVETFFDLAHRMIAVLDRLDGDPDFEPGCDAEDDGTAEPVLAALVGLASQTRWTGFDTLMTGEPA